MEWPCLAAVMHSVCKCSLRRMQTLNSDTGGQGRACLATGATVRRHVLQAAPSNLLGAGYTTENHPSSMAITEKPLPRGAPGGLLSILGGLVALGLILGVAVTVYTIYQRQHRMQSKADNDGTDIPATHKCAPPPPLKRSGDSRTLLTSDDIQVLRLDKEAHHKLPPQTPYYDMGPTQSNSARKDFDVQYAELDTVALACSPGPQGPGHPGGDLVEYATIQPSSQ